MQKRKTITLGLLIGATAVIAVTALVISVLAFIDTEQLAERTLTTGAINWQKIERLTRNFDRELTSEGLGLAIKRITDAHKVLEQGLTKEDLISAGLSPSQDALQFSKSKYAPPTVGLLEAVPPGEMQKDVVDPALRAHIEKRFMVQQRRDPTDQEIQAEIALVDAKTAELNRLLENKQDEIALLYRRGKAAHAGALIRLLAESIAAPPLRNPTSFPIDLELEMTEEERAEIMRRYIVTSINNDAKAGVGTNPIDLGHDQ